MLENEYDKTNDSFEKAVVQLQNNVTYLVNQGAVSDKFIALQNHIIKSLINYQHQTENIINELEWEITKLARGKVTEIERLKKVQESLEAACIIHGITDFPKWMIKGNNFLVNEAIINYRSDAILLPCLLKEKFDKLPTEEKELLDKILCKSYDDEIAKIRNEINQLQEKRNDITA